MTSKKILIGILRALPSRSGKKKRKAKNALVPAPTESALATRPTTPIVDPVQFFELRRVTRRRSRTLGLLAALTAVLPVIAVAIYVFLIATPMYTTEVRFSIRGSEASSSASSMGSMLASGGGVLGGLVDGYAARDFIASRDAMVRLQSRVDLRALLAHPNADPLVRLPADATEDELFDAYRTRVTARYNMMEQIVVLDVQAFSPADSETIARALIEVTEEFADQMNLRARTDALKASEAEVGNAEKRAADARIEMARWRDANGIVDPTADVTMINGLIGQLETQLTGSQNELAAIDATGARDHPRRRSLMTEIQTTKDRIAELRKRLGGAGSAAANQISRFEALKIAQEYAEQNLTAARQSLDFTRRAMLRQQKYVAVVAAPHADGRPSYPTPFTSLLAAAIIGIGLSFFGSLVFGVLRSHLAG